MKRVLYFFLLSALLIPIALFARQEDSPITLELTGVNPSDFPTVIVTANVYDRLGQPVFGLTQDNFAITGDLADRLTIVSVENIADSNLPISVVLAIDTSSSMAGTPFDHAKEAAINFINVIGPNDPIAIVAFDTTEQLVQDFTTDDATLLNAINSLSYGGKTSLYDGSLLAVQTAANSGSARRAVVLLSDGAEYGGFSSAGRNEALDQALSLGVPVYTIGLGYGFDRSYLQELSGATLGEFYESPTSEQLTEIYTNLAAKLRSQYVITLQADLPTDGTVYTLDVQVSTDAGEDQASAELRTPIPVPIVTLGDLPTAPISEPTDITAEVAADDDITAAEFSLDGTGLGALTEPPYTVTIDPATLLPGSHELGFSVTDATGDVTTASGTIEIAALPPVVEIVGLPSGEISEEVTITLDVTGQTPGANASFSLDGGEATTVTEAPFSFTINPAELPPGEHTLNVEVTNEGGATTTISQTFTIAALPPAITISGVADGDTLNAPTDVSVSAVGQSPITQISATLNGEELTSEAASEASFTINPASIQPGTVELVVTAVMEDGQSAAQTLSLTIPVLPPQVTITGIELGQILEENQTVDVQVDSQTEVTGVTYQIDGQEVNSQAEAPFSLELDVETLSPGAHTLTVEATNAGGETSTATIDFIVSEGPSLTLTALVPTNTPPPTSTPSPNPTVTAQVAATMTAAQQLLEMSTAQAQSASDAQATQNAQASAEATVEALAADTTADAQLEGTQNAQATINAQATLAAQSALDAQATASVGVAAEETAVVEETEESAEVTEESVAAPTEVAQAATATGEAEVEPTAPPVDLNAETQTSAQQNNMLPILCIVGAVVLLLVILFLVVGRQRRSSRT